MHPAVEQIRQYLQLIALQFVQHPEQAELRVAESPQGDAVRFRLILEKTDVARIIGRNGMTASAIRSLAKAAGEKHGIKVIVLMLSHEEAAEQP
ncbi:MAG TPA: KH domain-containing protein [Akkermansia muciniphila]|nr:KH domain-containing protein [Akkermansia muciniphila]